MKKCLAILLTLMMMLCSLTGLAETAPAQPGSVSIRCSVDRELAKGVLAQMGMDENTLNTVDAVAALISALGVDFVCADNGFQLNLGLNGTEVLSLAGESTAEGFALGSSLFPSYVISGTWESIMDMMQQFMPAASGEEGEVSMDFSAMIPSMEIDPQQLEAFTAAMIPGEPEAGSFMFEGYTFDTHTPMTVDTAAMMEAVKNIMTGILNDSSMQSFFRFMEGFDPEEVMKGFDEIISGGYIPDVHVDIYTNSDGSELFYTISEATFQGAEEPSYRFTMLNLGEGNGKYVFWMAEPQMEMSVDFSANRFFVSMTMMDQIYAAFAANTEDPNLGVFECYFMEPSKPLLTLTVSTSEGGERTLPLEGEEKTAISLMDLMSGEGSEATSGLMSELMSAGLGTAMSAIMEEVPEFMNLMMVTPSATEPTVPQEMPEIDPTGWKHLEDVLALPTTSMESTWDSEQYIYIPEFNGAVYVVCAPFSEELDEALSGIDFFAEDREEQILALLGPLEISRVIDMSQEILPQEELDQWVGKTIQEMLDAGWEYDGFMDDEDETECFLVNGLAQYVAVLQEKVEVTDEYYDVTDDIAQATVASLVYNHVSGHVFDAE